MLASIVGSTWIIRPLPCGVNNPDDDVGDNGGDGGDSDDDDGCDDGDDYDDDEGDHGSNNLFLINFDGLEKVMMTHQHILITIPGK